MNDSTKRVTYPKKFDGCRIDNEQQLLEFTEDLLLERDYYKKQLKDKDKEINKLKLDLRTKIGNIKTNDFIKLCLQCGFMVEANDKIDIEQIKRNITHQVCEKIRRELHLYLEDKTGIATITCLDVPMFKLFLDQIEKGEET